MCKMYLKWNVVPIVTTTITNKSNNQKSIEEIILTATITMLITNVVDKSPNTDISVVNPSEVDSDNFFFPKTDLFYLNFFTPNINHQQYNYIEQSTKDYFQTSSTNIIDTDVDDVVIRTIGIKRNSTSSMPYIHQMSPSSPMKMTTLTSTTTFDVFNQPSPSPPLIGTTTFSSSVNYSTSASFTLPFFTSSPVYNTAYNYADESEKNLFQQYLRNQALDTPILVALMTVYAILIFIGAFGNGLVCLAVARKPRMRTPQNLFIVNLAISDLLLCFFTIPFSLFEIATKFWPYSVTMCKLVLMLEATSIFVSTLSIIAIAIDRYHVILRSMNPDQCRRNRMPIVFKLILIWIVGIVLSLPLFLVRTVESHYIGIGPIDTINFCIEKWPIHNGRAYYSVLSMLIQYVGPIIIVSVVYARLCIKLRSRTLRRTSTTQLPKLRIRLQRRARKTNLLLISIALIFFISWLPLNVLNIVADFFPVSSFRITFAICHMFGMSSSCSNPFLYGWLNQTFRNEFREIFNSFRRLFYRIDISQELPPTRDQSDHSLSFSPNHRIIHYRPKNGRCTITDYSNVINHRPSDVIITAEKPTNKQTSLTVNNHNKVNSCPTDTTNFENNNVKRIYVTELVSDNETNQQNEPKPEQSKINWSSNNEQNTNSNSHYCRSAHCKFKRLSLADSRKRKRKDLNQLITKQNKNFVNLVDRDFGNNNNKHYSKS